MNTIIKYTLLTALRDWLFIGLFIAILFAFGLSVFTGSTALVEQSQMTLAYFAGASRIVLITGLIVFICFHVRRSFDNREIESILSKPISRVEFVISYWLGFVILASLAAVPVIIIISMFNSPDIKGLIYWSLSIIFEISIVLAFALVSALIMRSAVSSVLSSFAFYFISRLMGFFVAAMNKPTSLMGGGWIGEICEWILTIISIVIPRLDLFAKSDWLIYGTENQSDLWIFPAQALIFVFLLLSMAVFDFKRKQF